MQYSYMAILCCRIGCTRDLWLLAGPGDRYLGIPLSGVAGVHRTGGRSGRGFSLAVAAVPHKARISTPDLPVHRCDLYVCDLVDLLLVPRS